MSWDAHFQLAHELKMHLHELLGWDGPMTHRQFIVWHEWLLLQWNRPSRSDHYMMQVAAMQATKERPLSDWAIKFSSSQEPVEQLPEVLDEHGKHLFPRRMTKEMIQEAEQRNLFAVIASHPAKPNHQAAMSSQIDAILEHNKKAEERRLSKRQI